MGIEDLLRQKGIHFFLISLNGSGQGLEHFKAEMEPLCWLTLPLDKIQS